MYHNSTFQCLTTRTSSCREGSPATGREWVLYHNTESGPLPVPCILNLLLSLPLNTTFTFFTLIELFFRASEFYPLFPAIKINKSKNPPQSRKGEPSIAHSILFPDDIGDEEEEDDQRKPEECRTVLSHRRSL